MLHVTARDDDTRGDDGICSPADSVIFRMNELGRRQIAGKRVNWPILVIKIKRRPVFNEIHVSVVKLPDGTYIAPICVIVFSYARYFVLAKIIDSRLMTLREVGSDVSAHVVLGVFGFLILGKSVNKASVLAM